MNGTKEKEDTSQDDFWDIEKLVPRKATPLRPFATKPTAVDYAPDTELDSLKESEEKKAERKITFSEQGVLSGKKADDESYVPVGTSLIKRVTIKRYNDKYDFYGNFRKAALLYYDYKTPKCDYVPFFSYMPQYSQLTAEQKNYYFYWRSEIRRGKFPKTDYSYLYLYVYEILNLPDMIPAKEGIKILCRLWGEYRTAFPKISANFSVWIQDYCFIHKLPCPMEELHDFMHEAIAASPLTEFYLSDIEGADAESVGAMIAFLSDYDWRKGKFIQETDAAEYKKYMYTAMLSLLLHLAKEGTLYDQTEGLARVTRNAFPNSLCTHSVKCRLEIEYVSLSGAGKLRAAITAAVRYTENKIRQQLGVKSRLAVKDLPDEYKNVIDAYFLLTESREERIRARAKIPEYEKLYDAPSVGLSFEGADEIERSSWLTTQRLVAEAEEDCEEAIPAKNSSPEEPKCEPKEPKCEPKEQEKPCDECPLSKFDVEALKAIRAEASLDSFDGIELDSAVERINEAFSDMLGDVVIYHDGERYTIYDDYTEEIGEWLQKITK